MTTDFQEIKFDKEKHRYYLGDQELISVTKWLKKFETPFDRDGVARRVAERDGMTVDEVLADWDQKRDASLERGIAVHRHIEQVLKGEIDPLETPADEFVTLNRQLPEIGAFNALWYQLGLQVTTRAEMIEWVIGDRELGLAGTVDSVLKSNQTGTYHIWDWKTGKFDTYNKWDNFLTPFSNLDASKFNLYSLQVNLYRMILEQNTELKMGDSYLVHLSEGGFAVHKATDLREALWWALGGNGNLMD